MTSQYFFFDTYIGYFLQMLPIAILVGGIYGIVKYKLNKEIKLSKLFLKCLFVSYMTGLVGLVLLFDIVGDLWYSLFYHMDSGRTVKFFTGDFNLVPDFYNHINREVIGNLIMFLPFGILYPLSRTKPSYKNVVLTGIICVFIIELLQPVFGRAFDINDIILNAIGIIISATVFFVAQHFVIKK